MTGLFIYFKRFSEKCADKKKDSVIGNLLTSAKKLVL